VRHIPTIFISANVGSPAFITVIDVWQRYPGIDGSRPAAQAQIDFLWIAQTLGVIEVRNIVAVNVDGYGHAFAWCATREVVSLIFRREIDALLPTAACPEIVEHVNQLIRWPTDRFCPDSRRLARRVNVPLVRLQPSGQCGKASRELSPCACEKGGPKAALIIASKFR
jgi:hypothetical protein